MTLSELKKIIQDKYLHKGDYTLSSGAKSDKYFDIKSLTLSSDHTVDLINAICDMLDKIDTEINVRCIAGLELGGALLVPQIAYFVGDCTYCVIRKQQRIHGLKKMIEGCPKSPILLVDDVISSGDTLVDAAEVVVAAGFEIAGCLCVINRHPPEFDNFSCQYYGDKTVEFPIYSLFKESDFD